MTTNESPSPASGTPLSSPFKLLSAAWDIYKTKFSLFFALSLLSTVALLVALAIPLGSLIAGVYFFPAYKVPLLAVLIPVAFFAAVYAVCRFQLAFVIAVTKESCRAGEAMQESGSGVAAYFWTGLLSAYILIGGFLLFIIPGILFSIWLFLWPFIFVVNQSKGMKCLLVSKKLTSGKWWAIFYRLFIAWLLSTGLTVVPVIGPIFSLLLIPYNLIYAFLLYQELSAGRDMTELEAASGPKTFTLLLSALGFIAVLAGSLLFLFVMYKGITSGRFKGDKAQSVLSKFQGKFQSRYFPAKTGSAASVPAAKNSTMMDKAFTEAAEKIKNVSSAVRSTAIKQELTLKNGQTLYGSVAERDANGVWVETAPGVRSYWKNSEILEIKELNKPAESDKKS